MNTLGKYVAMLALFLAPTAVISGPGVQESFDYSATPLSIRLPKQLPEWFDQPIEVLHGFSEDDKIYFVLGYTQKPHDDYGSSLYELYLVRREESEGKVIAHPDQEINASDPMAWLFRAGKNDPMVLLIGEGGENLSDGLYAFLVEDSDLKEMGSMNVTIPATQKGGPISNLPAGPYTDIRKEKDQFVFRFTRDCLVDGVFSHKEKVKYIFQDGKLRKVGG